MTASDARRDLPAVPVLMPDGTIYSGKVTGRLNRFPTVSVTFIGQSAKRHLRDFGGKAWIDFHTTWEQVARTATSGAPIVYT